MQYIDAFQSFVQTDEAGAGRLTMGSYGDRFIWSFLNVPHHQSTSSIHPSIVTCPFAETSIRLFAYRLPLFLLLWSSVPDLI